MSEKKLPDPTKDPTKGKMPLSEIPEDEFPDPVQDPTDLGVTDEEVSDGDVS